MIICIYIYICNRKLCINQIKKKVNLNSKLLFLDNNSIEKKLAFGTLTIRNCSLIVILKMKNLLLKKEVIAFSTLGMNGGGVFFYLILNKT